MHSGIELREDTPKIDSRVPIALAAGGYVCVLITLIVYMYSLTLRTTIEARHFAGYLDACPATGLALILSSLAVVAAPKWSRVFWISVAGFVVAYVIALTTSAFFFIAGIYCCLVLIIVVVRRIRSIGWVTIALIAGFVAEFMLGFAFQGSTRPIVSRCQNDMRSIAIALESYRVDYNAYPASTTDPARRLRWKSDSAMPSFVRYWPGGPCSLTTPVQYQSELPVDPLRYVSERRTYAYYADPSGQKCVVIGAGVNCVFDLKPQDLDELTSNPLKFVNYQYDPTNGTASAGDIFRVEPR